MEYDSGSASGDSTGRRTYLKGLGATGIGLGILPTVRGGGNRKEIVLTRKDERPTETAHVPMKWYQHTKHAEMVGEELTNQLIDEPGVASVGIGTGESSIGGLRRKVVEVGLHGDATTTAIPERIRGIPVRVNEDLSINYQCYTGSYKTLQGGISCHDPPDDGTARQGTICCRVYDGGKEHLLTARHLFTSDGTGCTDGGTSFAGTSVYRDGAVVGTIADGSVEHDIVWAEIDSDNDINGDIVQEKAPVGGHVTKDGLSTFASDSQSVDFRGVASCENTFTVDSYDNSFSCDSGVVLTELVYYDASDFTEDKDSGGPIYYVNSSGEACITGILSGIVHDVDCGFLCTKDVEFGAAAYAIHDFWNLTFD